MWATIETSERMHCMMWATIETSERMHCMMWATIEISLRMSFEAVLKLCRALDQLAYPPSVNTNV